jgi:hypothetical protein
MAESLEEDGVLYECPLCVGETVLISAAGPFTLPSGSALRSSTGTARTDRRGFVRPPFGVKIHVHP